MGTLVHELKTKLPIDIFQVENNITYDKEPWSNVRTKVNISLSDKGNKENQQNYLKILALEKNK